MKEPRGFSHARQRGVVLFISLILLLVLTMTGVSAVQTTSLEQQTARNARDRMLAFQAAESALRDAERVIDALETPVPVLPVAEFGAPEPWRDVGVWLGPMARRAETALDGVAEPARYVVEHMGSVELQAAPHHIGDGYGDELPVLLEVFRITARGVGGSGRVAVVLQSTYARVMD
jgi:type IV pilus assembly protein PilX